MRGTRSEDSEGESEFPADESERPEEGIIWDVIEEHLDEAEFLVGQFDAALEGTTTTLDELAACQESRLLAHIDGLVIGGVPAAERFLLPLLGEPDPAFPAKATAVALALLAGAYDDRLAPALFHEEESIRRAIVRACALAGGPGLDRWVLAFLDAPEPRAVAVLLQLAAERELRIPRLLEYLQSDDDSVVRAAARGAWSADPRVHLQLMDHLLDHADDTVGGAALVANLAWGGPRAWATCERWALDRDRPRPLAMILYAALGGPVHHARLVESLALKSHRMHALFALGFSGNTAQMPVLLEHLRSDTPSVSKTAAQAISTITGLDLEDDAYSLSAPPAPPQVGPWVPVIVRENELDADLVPPPEEALPYPDVEAIHLWWQTEQPNFEPRRRYLGGKPFSPEVLFDYLVRAPLRRRYPLALALGVSTGGQIWINTRAFTERQRAQITAARAGFGGRFVRHYEKW